VVHWPAGRRRLSFRKTRCLPDHIHMCLSIPPKYSVAPRLVSERQECSSHPPELLKERRMTGLHFWAAGYCVSTVGWMKRACGSNIRSRSNRTNGKVNWTSSKPMAPTGPSPCVRPLWRGLPNTTASGRG